MGFLIENYDILTLAIKQKLIGSSIHLQDGSTKVIADFQFLLVTDQICLKFTDGTQNFFTIRDTFKITVPVDIPVVNSGKIKEHKK
jgi:hypothetical protein